MESFDQTVSKTEEIKEEDLIAAQRICDWEDVTDEELLFAARIHSIVKSEDSSK